MHTRFLNKLLGCAGLAIIRVPRTTWPRRRAGRAERAALAQDLRRLDGDGQGWASAANVRGYLTDDRIDFFHELLALVDDRGVRLLEARVIDVGTCTGYLLRQVGARHPGAQLTGTDTQEMFVRLAGRLAPKARILHRDILDGPLEERFDVVFCTEVLEHIVDAGEALDRVLGLAAPGGMVVLTVPNGRWDHSAAGAASPDGRSFAGHVNFWSPEGWDHFVRGHAAGRRVETGLMTGGKILFAIICEG